MLDKPKVMADNRSFLLSKLFKVIGPGDTVFKVHGDLLSKHSSVLDKAINGPMREKDTKTIEIKAVDDDLDDDTVMRFLEYVYTNDYTVPDPEVLQLSSDPAEVSEAFLSREAESFGSEGAFTKHEQPFGEVDSWDSSSQIPSKKAKKKRTRIFAEPEPELDFELEPAPAPVESPVDPFCTDIPITTRSLLWEMFRREPQTRRMEPWQPPNNNDEREDFTSIFLCHARLYKFSDRYDCPGLMELSLQRLRLTLSRYTFFQARAADVVELVRYAYRHTMRLEEAHDKLVEIVLDYVVCYVQQLSRDRSFVELLNESGPLAGDLLSKMVSLFQ